MGQPLTSFSIIFSLFKQTIQFLQQINVKNVKMSTSIQRSDSNPQPFKHESSPITTSPGLPLPVKNVFVKNPSFLKRPKRCWHLFTESFPPSSFTKRLLLHFKLMMGLQSSMTRLGDFQKLLATYFITKVAKKIVGFGLPIFENVTL